MTFMVLVLCAAVCILTAAYLEEKERADDTEALNQEYEAVIEKLKRQINE